MMAARSLITLFRTVNPELLKKKDRGKEATMMLKQFRTLQFGEQRATGIMEDIAVGIQYEMIIWMMVTPCVDIGRTSKVA
jgi:hypothetical protein